MCSYVAFAGESQHVLQQTDLAPESMLYAIWPSFRNIPNHLPKSANITTGFMICYFIYFVVVLPFHWIPPHKVRWVFTIKSIITPIAGFAILGYLVHATGGNKIFTFGNELKGSALGWGFMNGVNAMIGNFATLGVNMNDFARYSKKPKSPLIQLIVIPVVFLMMMIFGVVGANGSKILYGELLWDPLEIVDHWTSKGGRAAAFFCAAAFFIANIAINISANSIAVAVDLSALAPRYINIRRGQYICAFIGAWALTPWNILVSADSLLTFMDGYSVWLAPISSVLICDYYFVHHRLVAVHELYRPHGVYAYEKWGTNWRSAVAFVVGFAPLLPGFANAVTSSISVSTGAIHLYDLGYFYGFIVPGVLYVGLSRIFPPKSQYSLDGRTIQEEVREKVSIEEHRHGQPHFV
ncbi:putative ncs1 allantoate transporter [Phaeomoniella chlamydospora]|uniref:Putative ncs1 allantoate transporter n=1 Tax=Phaeomoniella chlamydospora TaxID=158046 RepID=A0A0G2FZM3_PHACM|nr:putative ncs1 allantoate transporter [Phaeomoniella chlamydospora]